jgi:hypothetical protein
MAARLFAGQRVPDEFVEVPLDAWLTRWNTHRERRVLEHSVLLPSYAAVLSFIEFAIEQDSAMRTMRVVGYSKSWTLGNTIVRSDEGDPELGYDVSVLS